MLANVKIEQGKEKPWIHRVYQDGNEIKRIVEANLNIRTDSFPEVNITIDGGCDFEGMADIHFDYSPYTVKEACKILRDELLKHGDLYDGFLSSIKSAVIEYAKDCYAFGGDSEILAEEILDRIIGEEPNERKD